MPRGRLIFDKLCDIARLDTATMESAGRQDDIWRETIKEDTDNDGLGEEQREELATITVPAQIERDRDELQRLTRSGDVPDSAVGLVVHMRQMERDDLVNSDGSLKIGKNDRLVRISNKRGVVEDTYDRQRVFCHHTNRLQDVGGGSNLALLLFSDRPPGRV